MKTKPKPMAAELLPSGESYGGNEIRYLYINGKTDKAPYIETYNMTLEGDFWEIADEYHKSKIFDALMELDASDVPDHIKTTFEQKIKHRYAEFNHISISRKKKEMIWTFNTALVIRQRPFNPFLFHDYLKKHLTVIECPDEEPEWFPIEVKHITSGKMQNKLEGSLRRITHFMDEAEKHLLRRIKKL
jgi:hypothetical protein